MIYGPAEDSFLLQEQIRNFARGIVLDMGTGSGILAEEASQYCDKVIAVDVQESVISELMKKNKNPKVEYLVSDLFSNIREKFDLIIFNPPYLPEDNKLKEITLDGGKKGHEIIARFLSGAKAHLNKDGKILLLFSSLTGRKKVEQLIAKNKFEFKQIAEQKMGFEELRVYLIF